MIAGFKIPDLDREKIKEGLYNKCNIEIDFFLLSALSATIATLGLIINSPATVIGGMLISPLFYPIISISMTITRGNAKLFEKSLFNLLKLVLIVILFSFICAAIAPSNGITNEILERSEPNILHLFIALLSGCAGAISLLFPRVASSLAGVLVASAIVPPLGAVGYGLAKFNPEIIAGSFLLFVTNLLSIIFMGVVVFYLFGFTSPKNYKAKKLIVADVTWSSILLLIVAIPLFISLSSSMDKENKISRIRSIINSEFEQESLTGATEVNIIQPAGETKVKAVINRTKLPTEIEYIEIKNRIEDFLDKEVIFELVTNRNYIINSEILSSD